MFLQILNKNNIIQYWCSQPWRRIKKKQKRWFACASERILARLEKWITSKHLISHEYHTILSYVDRPMTPIRLNHYILYIIPWSSWYFDVYSLDIRRIGCLVSYAPVTRGDVYSNFSATECLTNRKESETRALGILKRCTVNTAGVYHKIVQVSRIILLSHINAYYIILSCTDLVPIIGM